MVQAVFVYGTQSFISEHFVPDLDTPASRTPFSRIASALILKYLDV
jgi:hypothetical protein